MQPRDAFDPVDGVCVCRGGWQIRNWWHFVLFRLQNKWGRDKRKQTAPLIIYTYTLQSWRQEEINHGFGVLFRGVDWLGSNNVIHLNPNKTSCDCFLPPLLVIFLVSAPMETFAFEPLNTSLTVPNPPVTRRAAITLTTTVIEPQRWQFLLPTSYWAQESKHW